MVPEFSRTELYISLVILGLGALPLVLYAVRGRRGKLRNSEEVEYRIPSKLVIFHVLSYASLAFLFGVQSAKSWIEDDEDENDGKKRYQMYLASSIVAFFLFYVLYIGSFLLSDSFVVDRRVMGLDKLGEYFQMLCKSVPESYIAVIAKDANMSVIRSSRVRVKIPFVTDKTEPLSALEKVNSGSFRLKLDLDVQWSGNAKEELERARRMLIERESAKGGSVSAELVSHIHNMNEEIFVVEPGKGLPWYFSLGSSVVASFLLLGLGFVVLLNIKVPVLYHTIVKEVSPEGQQSTQQESKKSI